MSQIQKFFRTIHNDGFRWNDFFLVPVFASIVFMLVGELLGQIITYAVNYGQIENLSPLQTMFWLYFAFIGIWIVTVVWCLVTPSNRPIFKAVWTKPKGNNPGMLGLGLLLGFVTNSICVLAAWLNKDINLVYDSVPVGPLLLILAAVFVQSSAEELTDRCFLYQRLRRGYRSPWVAILINSSVFALMHLGNPDVSGIAMADLIISGIVFSLCVYYLDSLWLAFGMHTAWNFTQNIIFGLPNSGIVSDYSIFKLDAATVRASMFYDPGFGVEGTALSVLVQIITGLLIAWIGSKRKQADFNPWLERA